MATPTSDDVFVAFKVPPNDHGVSFDPEICNYGVFQQGLHRFSDTLMAVETLKGSRNMIAKLHAELLSIADDLHVAADRGLYNLSKMPYRGAQWDLRAFQRDPYVMAFIQC